MGEEKRVEVERWLAKADHDIRAARSSLKENPPITDVACFLAQQCAEKSLKAFLVFNNIQPDKIHDLGKLVGQCGNLNDSFSSLIPMVAGMSQYAVQDRYPDDWREIMLDEAQEAVTKAEKVMAFVKGKIPV
ncbi:MAG: HEPN domain-containing protein [Nitrospinae bacterium]|nr:HEPN domain-containing protein [Nitrospinota bacterium]